MIIIFMELLCKRLLNFKVPVIKCQGICLLSTNLKPLFCSYFCFLLIFFQNQRRLYVFFFTLEIPWLICPGLCCIGVAGMALYSTNIHVRVYKSCSENWRGTFNALRIWVTYKCLALFKVEIKTIVVMANKKYNHVIVKF